jgi:tetratricopeptide (TPR) repeat protein
MDLAVAKSIAVHRILTVIAFFTVLPGCASLNAMSAEWEKQDRELTEIHDQPVSALRCPQPEGAEPWFLLGNLYAERGRLVEAERAYRQSLKYANQPKVLHNLGLVQIRLGIDALREARRQLPSDDPVYRETLEYLESLVKGGLWEGRQ